MSKTASHTTSREVKYDLKLPWVLWQKLPQPPRPSSHLCFQVHLDPSAHPPSSRLDHSIHPSRSTQAIRPPSCRHHLPPNGVFLPFTNYHTSAATLRTWLFHRVPMDEKSTKRLKERWSFKIDSSTLQYSQPTLGHPPLHCHGSSRCWWDRVRDHRQLVVPVHLPDFQRVACKNRHALKAFDSSWY